MTLIPTDESKSTQKKYEKLRGKIRGLIRPISNKLDNYEGKYIKGAKSEILLDQ